MKIIAMAVAYERPVSMRILIDSFLVQTNPNWELTIVHDGWASDEVWKTLELYDDPRIRYRQSEERYGQYGHYNRKKFLKDLDADPLDYILLTNDDNYYVPVMVNKVLSMCNDSVGLVFWDIVHSHFDYDVLKSQIKVDRIDVGSFVVRADVAKSIGFNQVCFNGDGYYAENCAGYCANHKLSIKYIPKCLFVHN